VNVTIEAATREMSRYGKQFETKIFSGTGHGFLRVQDTHGVANRAASEHAR